MCKFCDENYDFSDIRSLEIVIMGDVLTISYDAYSADSSFSDDIVINYCPMCGKKLKKYVQDTKNT